MASHCLICGASSGGGLYCKDCEWEICKLRLGNEMDFETWLNIKLVEHKTIMIDNDKYNMLDRF